MYFLEVMEYFGFPSLFVGIHIINMNKLISNVLNRLKDKKDHIIMFENIAIILNTILF